MTDAREVEAKFNIDPVAIARLSQAIRLGQFRETERRTVIQDDLYFDTRSQALAAARSSFRLRRKADGAQVTFKGSRDAVDSADEAHVASRLEDEVRVGVDTARRIEDGDFRAEDERLSPIAKARAIAGVDPLSPIARLENERVVVVLTDGDGRELELSIDTCRGTRLSDGRVTSFHELELEAKSAGRQDVLAVATELLAAVPGIRPNRRTKLERVLR